MASLTCPYTESCAVYRNWVEQIGGHRLNIISKYAEKGYSCMALDALFDTETGIPRNEELQKGLVLFRFEKTECSHIDLLNGVESLVKFVIRTEQQI